MKEEGVSILKTYLRNLFHQASTIITGIIAFVILSVNELFLKNSNLRLVYLLVFTLAIVLGTYQVYKSLFLENKVMEKKLEGLEKKQPVFRISLRKNNGQSSERVELLLNPIPLKPDIQKLIEEERKSFDTCPIKKNNLGKRVPGLEITIPKSLLRTMDSIGESNSNYDKEIEDYLEEYENYLMHSYECTVNRAFEIFPIFENIGQYPASNITFELIMPPLYKIPLEHQRFNRDSSDFERMRISVKKPQKPKMYKDALLKINYPILDSLFPPPSMGISNVIGPDFTEKNGIVHIIYKVEKIIQHTPEINIDPFWVWLGDIEQEGVWEVKVRITAAELREPKEDFLYLVITKP